MPLRPTPRFAAARAGIRARWSCRRRYWLAALQDAATSGSRSGSEQGTQSTGEGEQQEEEIPLGLGLERETERFGPSRIWGTRKSQIDGVTPIPSPGPGQLQQHLPLQGPRRALEVGKRSVPLILLFSSFIAAVALSSMPGIFARTCRFPMPGLDGAANRDGCAGRRKSVEEAGHLR